MLAVPAVLPPLAARVVPLTLTINQLTWCAWRGNIQHQGAVGLCGGQRVQLLLSATLVGQGAVADPGGTGQSIGGELAGVIDEHTLSGRGEGGGVLIDWAT